MTNAAKKSEFFKKLQKCFTRWDEAPTERRKINAVKAALSFLEGAALYGWVLAAPDGPEVARWTARLAQLQGRPRALPPFDGCWVTWVADKAPSVSTVASVWTV